ncbi:MAG: hypothetical protein U0457_17040 [Candidatus Sericytochromatia bacterium]
MSLEVSAGVQDLYDRFKANGGVKNKEEASEFLKKAAKDGVSQKEKEMAAEIGININCTEDKVVSSETKTVSTKQKDQNMVNVQKGTSKEAYNFLIDNDMVEKKGFIGIKTLWNGIRDKEFSPQQLVEKRTELLKKYNVDSVDKLEEKMVKELNFTKSDAKEICDALKGADHNVTGKEVTTDKLERKLSASIKTKEEVKEKETVAKGEDLIKDEIPRLESEIKTLKEQGVDTKDQEAHLSRLKTRYESMTKHKLTFIPSEDQAITKSSMKNVKLKDAVKDDLSDVYNKFKGNPEGLMNAINKKYPESVGKFNLEQAQKILNYAENGITKESEVKDLQDTLASVNNEFQARLSKNGKNSGHDGKYGYATTECVRYLSADVVENTKINEKDEQIELNEQDEKTTEKETFGEKGAKFTTDKETIPEKVIDGTKKTWENITAPHPKRHHVSKKDWGSTKCPKF